MEQALHQIIIYTLHVTDNFEEAEKLWGDTLLENCEIVASTLYGIEAKQGEKFSHFGVDEIIGEMIHLVDICEGVISRDLASIVISSIVVVREALGGKANDQFNEN